jgi:small redox-active disulfide protein 2
LICIWLIEVTAKSIIQKKGAEVKEIKILGTGCPKCNKLVEVSETAAGELGIDYELEKITDIKAIMSYGVMITPTLVVDGDVKVAGRVPDTEEIKKMLA